jgi:tetratricopeptide (TPR) repeat protein
MEFARPGRDETLLTAPTVAAGPFGADQSEESVDRDDLVFERLMRWEAAYLRGEDPAPESICRDDPALVGILGEWIAKRKKLYGLIGLRETADSIAADRDLLPVIPGHELIREIGRGGMGVVYLARDRRLGRIVAIKTIAQARLATPDQINRFLLEARAVARLRHPNIIAIHAIGEDPSCPYLSLEFVEGTNLAQRLADRPMASLEAAVLLESLARAIHAVHEEGIVHRDLKPSNVLLTALGEPKIADFGLAKLKDGGAGRTLSEQVLGTPSYMAPEQALGRSKQAGPSADVYALGAILYQALAGRPPFLGESAIETLKLVVSTEPVPPRRQRPDVPRDLETICLRCLEKEPARRYAGAAALAEDLRRFREGRPIAARPVGPLGRVFRWSRRNKTLAVTAATLTLTFVFGTPVLLALWLRARADHALAMTERNRARIERDHAERSRDRAIGAVQVLLETESDEMLSEEMRPYRKRMIDAGLRESLALVRELDGDPRAELEVIRAYSGLAQIQSEAGERAAAVGSLRKSIALAERVAARDPRSVRSRGILATVLHRASTLLPEPAERRSTVRRSTEILETLIDDDSGGDRRTWLRLLAMNHYNDGHYLFGVGRGGEAVIAFRAARRAYEALLGESVPEPNELFLAAKNLLYLCRAYGERFDDSMEAGEAALAILRKLVAEHPESFAYAIQLCLALEEIGLKGVAAAKWELAIRGFEGARQMLKLQAEKWGKMVSRAATIQESLANADYNLWCAYDSDPPRYAGPLRELTRELFEICEKLSLLQLPSWNLRIAHAQACLTQAGYRQDDGLPPDLGLLLKAERLWEGIHREGPTHLETRRDLVIVRRAIALALEERGQIDEAVERRRRSLTTARGYPELFFELAAGYAKGAALVGRVPTKLDAGQLESRRARLTAEAIAMLRESAADGFHDARRLRTEPALEPFQSLPEVALMVLDLEFPADPFAAALR